MLGAASLVFQWLNTSSLLGITRLTCLAMLIRAPPFFRCSYRTSRPGMCVCCASLVASTDPLLGSMETVLALERHFHAIKYSVWLCCFYRNSRITDFSLTVATSGCYVRRWMHFCPWAFEMALCLSCILVDTLHFLMPDDRPTPKCSNGQYKSGKRLFSSLNRHNTRKVIEVM